MAKTKRVQTWEPDELFYDPYESDEVRDVSNGINHDANPRPAMAETQERAQILDQERLSHDPDGSEEVEDVSNGINHDANPRPKKAETRERTQTLDPERLSHDPDGSEEMECISNIHEAKKQHQSRKGLFERQRGFTIKANNGSLSLFDKHASRIMSSTSSQEEFVEDIISQADAWRSGIINLVESQTALRDQLRQAESKLEEARAQLAQLGQVESSPSLFIGEDESDAEYQAREIVDPTINKRRKAPARAQLAQLRQVESSPSISMDEDESDAEYEAQEIVDSTINKRRKDSATGNKGCLMYKIKYRGEDDWNADPPWQPWEDAIGCPYLVADYHHKNGDTKPGPHSLFEVPSDWTPLSI